MWGSNALRSFFPWAAETVRLGWRSFDGVILLRPPGKYHQLVGECGDGHPSERLRRQTVAFNRHDITTDHIPVLICRMKHVEEGGIESLFAFSGRLHVLPYNAQHKFHLPFVCSQAGVYLLVLRHPVPVKRPCA
jgi:hypothetical protein